MSSFANVFPTDTALLTAGAATAKNKDFGYGEDYVTLKLIALPERGQGLDYNVPIFQEYGQARETLGLEFLLAELGAGREIYERHVIEAHRFAVVEHGLAVEKIITNRPHKRPVEIEIDEE